MLTLYFSMMDQKRSFAGKSGAYVKLNPDGTGTIVTGAQESGTGAVMAMPCCTVVSWASACRGWSMACRLLQAHHMSAQAGQRLAGLAWSR